MLPDHRGYEGESDLDKIKAQEKLLETGRFRRSSGLLIVLAALALLLLLQFFASRKISVMDGYYSTQGPGTGR